MTLASTKSRRHLIRTLGGGAKSYLALEAALLPTVVGPLTADHTAADGEVVLVDSTAAVRTVHLPAPDAGTHVRVKLVAGADALTIARHGSESIDGTAADLTTSTAGTKYDLYADGTNWHSF